MRVALLEIKGFVSRTCEVVSKMCRVHSMDMILHSNRRAYSSSLELPKTRVEATSKRTETGLSPIHFEKTQCLQGLPLVYSKLRVWQMLYNLPDRLVRSSYRSQTYLTFWKSAEEEAHVVRELVGRIEAGRDPYRLRERDSW